MNKLVNVLYLLRIAVWPALFLLIIGHVELSVRVRAGMSFDHTYHVYTMGAYFLSGLIFAVGSFERKRHIKRQHVHIACIVGGALVAVFCTYWMLAVGGTVQHRVMLLRSVPFSNIMIMSLVFGYTMYLMVRALVWFRKEKIRRDMKAGRVLE